MLLSVITTFFAINIYMNLSATIAPDSPIYSWQLALSMSTNVFTTYWTFTIVIATLAAILLYICV